jgi:hypothetical protein
MTQASDFTIPGFEFLQNLMKNAGGVLPGVGQWVAPTLDSDELDKRIQELRAVQFWLEQNSHMLTATIQAMEVQRMTLATLKTMNVQMDDLRKSMHIQEPSSAEATTSPDADKKTSKVGMVDPMQWWSAITQQFSSLAQEVVSKGVTTTPMHSSPATATPTAASEPSTSIKSARKKPDAKSAPKAQEKTAPKASRKP